MKRSKVVSQAIGFKNQKMYEGKPSVENHFN